MTDARQKALSMTAAQKEELMREAQANMTEMVRLARKDERPKPTAPTAPDWIRGKTFAEFMAEHGR